MRRAMRFVKRQIRAVQLLRGLWREVQRSARAEPMPKPLLEFFAKMRDRTCACRTCEVAFAALQGVDASRLVLPAGRRLGEMSAPQEAEGLMRAAVVVLMFAHHNVASTGVPTIDVDARMGAFVIAVRDSLRAFDLPTVIAVTDARVAAAATTVPPSHVH